MRPSFIGALSGGTALLVAASAFAGGGSTYLGFRLLDMEQKSVRWHTPVLGSGATITYAFVTEPVTSEGARNCARMQSAAMAYTRSGIAEQDFRNETAEAFRMWEKVANLAFREISDPAEANILIGAQADPIGRAFTNVALKASATDNGGLTTASVAATTISGAADQPATNKVIGRSLICLNPEQPWKIGFDGRLQVYDLRYTMAHEIGHAIGLDHPSASGQLMSYRYDERHQGLQPGDIEGAVTLYGARPATEVYANSDSSTEAAVAPDAEDGRTFGIGDTVAVAPPETGSITPIAPTSQLPLANKAR
ncbi:matrixin family metalloprotease [Hyphomicrobium sp. D-2]|uniref:matrixin family metalloprotease n=1 Tax=Hyphomicrobium sp. D-2 TaxID=3041621 RepID=UPI0024568D87|nr:matrixin family metalloprotease [Hyphomicrobium sp. D-2]MDH4983342.1 matrixin family metalloprotease [Hyphomicrobium sp. D-2]